MKRAIAFITFFSSFCHIASLLAAESDLVRNEQKKL